MTIFSKSLDYALGWTVLHSIWQITLIAIITGIILFVYRNRSAQQRYWLANGALFTMLIVAVATFMYYSSNVGYEQHIIQEQMDAGIQAATNTEKAAPSNFAKTVVDPVVVAAKRPVFEEEYTFSASFRGYFEQHLPMVVMIWLLGLAICLFRVMTGISYVYYLKQRMNFHADPFWTEMLEDLLKKANFKHKIDLLESALVRSPVTIGLLKPVILFPIGFINRLPEREVEAILAHELAHIIRRDYLFNILQSLVEALFYYHPAVWWLSAQVRNERESACDDMAIALLGNKLNYAKALVTIQEMAFTSLSPALGFAGDRKGQLMHRVQRLFSQQNFKLNAMEKWITTALVVCSIAVLAFGQQIHQYYNSNHIEGFNSYGDEAQMATSGVWEATFEKDSVCLSLVSRTRRSNWMIGDCYPKSDFTNLNLAAADKTEFSMVRPAGNIVFKGAIEDNGGYGRYEFTPNEAFKTSLSQSGIKDADDNLLLHCFFANFQSDYVANMQQKGFKITNKDDLTELAVFRLDTKTVDQYVEMTNKLGKKNISVQDLVELKVHEVSPKRIAAFAQAGYGNMGLDDIKSFSIHGIDPAFIEQMNATGFGKLSEEDMIAAKIHDIDPQFIADCAKMNLGKLSFEDIVSMKIHGISTEYVSSAVSTGILPSNADLDDITSMKIHNISAEYVKECQQMGFGKLDMDEIMTVKIHGITPEYAKGVQGLGLGQLSFDDVVTAKIHGIDGDYIKKVQDLGLGKLSFDDILSTKIHGLDFDFVKKAQNMGMGKLDFEDLLQFKIHGVDESVLNEYKQMNIGPLDKENLVQMRIHRVSADQLKDFRDMGLKDIDFDDLVAAKIHGVTPNYIKECEAKGYKLPYLGDYIDLKIRGYGQNRNRN
jgi:beta-lactamase regulating signal transducer with metallopeptidase domain